MEKFAPVLESKSIYMNMYIVTRLGHRKHTEEKPTYHIAIISSDNSHSTRLRGHFLSVRPRFTCVPFRLMWSLKFCFKKIPKIPSTVYYR